MFRLKDERIVVTGGAGFLGSYVAESLHEHGAADVFIPRSRDYDLTEADAIRRLLAESRPSLVIHLAGVVGGIGANLERPGDFFYKNLMMGAQLMEHSRLCGVKKFVAVGTVCAYPKHAPVPFSESDLWNGYPEETNAPYGLAKKMLLVQSQAYRKQYGFNSIFLLPTNLYGPRDNFDPKTSHVIPAMIRKFHHAKAHSIPSVTLWGDGTPTREFLFAKDCAEGIVLAAQRYEGPEPVNIGSGAEVSMHHLASLIAGELGYAGTIAWDKSRPNGQPRRMLDISRAKGFGFEAKTPFRAGLRKTIDWYLSVFAGEGGGVR